MAAVEVPNKTHEEAVGMQDEDPLLQKQSDEASLDVKSKRKKRFKNFRGTETEYAKAVFEGVMNFKKEAPDEAVASSQLASSESEKDGLLINNENSALNMNDAVIEESESSPKEIVNSDVDYLSQQMKTPDKCHEAEKVKEDSASTEMDESIITNIVELNKETGTSAKEKCVVEAKTKERRKSKPQKMKREVEDGTAPSNVTEKKKECSIVAMEDRELSKDTGTNISKEVQYKERTATSFKPKDINLTDSWFVAARTTRKRSGNLDKGKSISKNASENANARASVRNSSSNANIANENSLKIKPPIIGKFLPVEKRKSVTRKRRIKNVSVNGVLSGDFYGAVSGDSQPECFTEKSSADIENSKLKEESSDSLQSADDPANVSPSLSQSSKEDSGKAPRKLSETSNLPEVTVALTRLSELKLIEHSAIGHADTIMESVTNTKNSVSSSDMTQNVIQQEDDAVFDSSQTISDKNGQPVDGNSSGNNEIVSVSSSNDEALCEKSSSNVIVGEEVPPAEKAVEEAKNEFTGSSSNIEVKFSMPVEVIEGRSLGESSVKTNEKGHGTRSDEKDLASGGQKELANDASSNVMQERQSKDGSNEKLFIGTSSDDGKRSKEGETENSPIAGRKLNRRFSKSSDKDLKNVKSGKSFIIKTPVNNAEKQVAVRPMNSKARRASKDLNNDESDPDIDITALNNDDNAGKEDAGKEVRVKRKIYTVVRKIRRTEISADGKKVTKIIKQIVKKVCPVTNELPVAPDKKKDATTEKQGKEPEKQGREPEKQSKEPERQGKEPEKKTKETEKQSMEPDYMPEKPVEDRPENVASKKARPTLKRKCGRCNGCLRKEDCTKCDACRFVCNDSDNKLGYLLSKSFECEESLP